MPHAKLIIGVIVLVVVVALGVRILPSGPLTMREQAPPAGAPVTLDVDAADFEAADVSGFIRHDLPKVLTFRSPTTFAEHMTMSRPYLTEDGYAQLSTLFTQMRWFEENEATEMRFTSEPVVKQESDAAGRAYWRADVTMDVDFMGGGSTRTDSFNTTLIIKGKDLNGEPALGIEQVAFAALAKPQ